MHGSPAIPFDQIDLTWVISTGALIAIQCALLSVLVVLKRMAFISQGISHAALAGVGVAAILGVTHGPLYFAIVSGACLFAALFVGWLSDRKATTSDTAIGIVLVASMSLGVVLLQLAKRNAEHDHGHDHNHDAHAWEELLFGSLTKVGRIDAIIAGALLLVTIALALRYGRSLLFWAFDERAACAFGAPTKAAKIGLMIALAATIVASMKLVGVILATALLVLPGVCALRLSSKLPVVLAISIITALSALGVGLGAAYLFSIPVGGSIVLALVLCYALTWPLSHIIPVGHADSPSPSERTTA